MTVTSRTVEIIVLSLSWHITPIAVHNKIMKYYTTTKYNCSDSPGIPALTAILRDGVPTLKSSDNVAVAVYPVRVCTPFEIN